MSSSKVGTRASVTEDAYGPARENLFLLRGDKALLAPRPRIDNDWREVFRS
jgi:hypothetical protein